jgi:adenylate kinase
VVLVWLAALVSRMYAAGPVVMLIGAPGSGRTTQAEILRKERGMPVISADDLIARNLGSFQKPKAPVSPPYDPHLDPALNQLVEQALGAADLSKGVVLDGYPASKAQGDFLAGLKQRLNLSRTLVIHLDVPDQVSQKRLKKQSRPDLEQQLKDYHRELDFAREYFPQADIRDVDATRKPADVAKQIRKILEEPRQ